MFYENSNFSDLIRLSSDQFRTDMLYVIQDVTNGSCYSITHDDFKSQLMQDVRDYLSLSVFGNMCYENRTDYAKTFHDHDNYTKVSCTQIAHLDSTDEISSIFKMYNGTTGKYDELSIKYDNISKYEDEYQPLIGSLKFCCSQDRRVTDLNTLSGWVTPCGQTYNLSQFDEKYTEKLRSIFGSTSSDTITIPNIDNFFKFRNNISDEESFSKTPYQLGLMKHNHSASSSGNFSKTISLNSDIWCERMNVNSTTAQQNPPSHYTHEKVGIHGSTNFVSLATQTINSVFGTTVNFKLSESGVNQEPYPKHDKIHILMYVGKPKT